MLKAGEGAGEQWGYEGLGIGLWRRRGLPASFLDMDGAGTGRGRGWVQDPGIPFS